MVPEQRMVFVEPVGQVLERTVSAVQVDVRSLAPASLVGRTVRTAPLAENLVETAQPGLLCPLERVEMGIVVQQNRSAIRPRDGQAVLAAADLVAKV
jgi:hypothetical protein